MTRRWPTGRALTLLFISMLSVPAASRVSAQTPGESEITAKNVKCGLLTQKPSGLPIGTSSSGETSGRRNFRLEKENREIPAKRGVAFGILYTLNTFLGTGTTPVRVVFTYPEPGLRNPKTGKTLLSSENMFAKKYDVEQVEAFTFEEDWELVPGQWRVQVFDRQKKLAECAFKVAKPEGDQKPPAVRLP